MRQVIDVAGWSREQEAFFDRLSADFGPYDLSSESPASRRSTQNFFEVLDIRPGCSAIELGCGRGEWIIKLASRGISVTGVDFSQKSLEVLGAELNKSQHSATLLRGDVQGDISELVGRQVFDRVFCYNLLHHVTDIEKVVANMVSLTKTGGKVVAYEPNPLHFWWYICQFFDRKFRWEVERGLMRTLPFYITRIFAKSGLSRVKFIPWDYFPFISPDRVVGLTNKLHQVLVSVPLIRYLPAVYVVEGYKL